MLFADATDVITRHGRIGSQGRETGKSFGDEAAALAFMEKQIAKKTEKGYAETQPDE